MTNYQRALTKLKGFTDGAGSRAMSTDLMTGQVEIYEQGYVEGQKSRREASNKFAAEFGVRFDQIVLAQPTPK